MTADGHDHVFGESLPYIPKVFYRDVVGVDPRHSDELRERDLEVFRAHGTFCRQAVPGEFTAEELARVDVGSLVIVNFGTNGGWQHELRNGGAPQPLAKPRPRRRSTGRRKA